MHELHIFGTNFIMPYIMLLPKPLVFFLLILEYSAETQVGWIRRVKKTQGGLGIKSRWTLLASFSSVNSLIWKKKLKTVQDNSSRWLKCQVTGDLKGGKKWSAIVARTYGRRNWGKGEDGEKRRARCLADDGGDAWEEVHGPIKGVGQGKIVTRPAPVPPAPMPPEAPHFQAFRQQCCNAANC